MFRTILIDDEKLAIARLERLLAKHADTFDIIGRANNGAEGLSLVETLKPDVIFLDIEMPVMTGFEMLSRLTHVPMVIFATAFDEYAIKAFEQNSIDYLLKPIEEDRLHLTVQKLNKLQNSQADASVYSQQMLKLLEQMQPKKTINSLSVKTGNKLLILQLDEISYFEAEDKYVFLITTDGQKFLTSYTISTLEEKLPRQFLRVSRSTIINTQFLREAEKHFNGRYILIMRDKAKTKITSGQTFSDEIRAFLELWEVNLFLIR